MTPGNLGIVFGPTLLRPRPTEATVSLSSLVDYPHQARVVETLIAHYGLIFEEEPEDVPGGQVRAAAGPRAAHPEQGRHREPRFQQGGQAGPQRRLLSKEPMGAVLDSGGRATPPPPASGARPHPSPSLRCLQHVLRLGLACCRLSLPRALRAWFPSISLSCAGPCGQSVTPLLGPAGVQGWQDTLGSTPDLSLLPPWDKHSSCTAQDLVSSHVQLHRVLTSFRLQFLVNL